MISIMDSTGLVDSSVRARVPVIPSRLIVKVACRPSRKDAAAPGRLRAWLGAMASSSAAAWSASAMARRPAGGAG
jgi:hypothetical protein